MWVSWTTFFFLKIRGLLIEYHFEKDHKMQEIRSNCFGSKNVALPETIFANFLHLMVLFFKVIFNHTSKSQFVVLLCHIIVWYNYENKANEKLTDNFNSN